MKKSKFVLFGLLATLLVPLAACGDKDAWSAETEQKMLEQFGIVLPSVPTEGKTRVDGFRDDGSFFASLETNAKSAMTLAASYATKLTSGGFNQIQEWSNTSTKANTNEYYEVFKTTKTIGSVEHEVFVEVSAGDFKNANKKASFYHEMNEGVAVDVSLDLDAVYRQAAYRPGMTYANVRKQSYVSEPKATGRQINMLIPINFTDYRWEDLPGGQDRMLDYVEKAYNGKAEDTGWESLNSFYTKSSKGKIQIESKIPYLGEDEDGKPLRVYETGMSTTEFVDKHINDYDGGNGGHIVFKLLQDITTYLFGLHGGTSAYNKETAEFDLDNDMFIDNVWLIYPFFSAPGRSSGKTKYGIQMPTIPAAKKEVYDDVFWAFTHHNYYNNQPAHFRTFYTLAWMSWDMLFENGQWNNGAYRDWTKEEIGAGTARVDARTVIHEHGHVLSMPDYYTYDSNDWGPLGRLDMMDNNIGDHGGYSKLNYGWAMPLVVEHPTSVTLKPFQEANDVIVLPAKNGWKDTLLDEYLILEYFTPDGLNEQDSQFKYRGPSSGYPLHFQSAGLKVTHIDSRIGLSNYNQGKGTWDFTSYVDSIYATGDRAQIGIVADNTKSRSVSFFNKNTNTANDTARLAHILEPSGLNTLKTSGTANDSFLWKTGAKFGTDKVFENWYLNSGVSFGWRFEVTEMTAAGITINFI